MNRLPLVVSVLALCVSLTASGAYASGLINGGSIKAHSITANKLTAQAIKQLHGAKGDTGAVGPAGAAGAAGLPGAAGAAGLPGGFSPAKLSYNYGPTAVIAVGSNALASAACPPGASVVGGGWLSQGTPLGSVSESYATDPDGWAVTVVNPGASTVVGNAFAICSAP